MATNLPAANSGPELGVLVLESTTSLVPDGWLAVSEPATPLADGTAVGSEF